jgi:hypothetical protein
MKEDKKLILSDSVLKSESKKLAIQSNLGMVPLVLGTCATPILFVMEQVVFMYASLGVVSLGVLAIIINVFFRTSAFKRIYLEKHNKKMEKEAKDRREKLKEDLSTEAAIQQISAFERKYDLFKVSLNKNYHQVVFHIKGY